MSLQLSPTQKAKLLELYQALRLDHESVTIQLSPTLITVQTNEQVAQLTVPAHYRRIRFNNLDKYINDAFNAPIKLNEELYQRNDLQSFINIAVDPAQTKGQRLYAYSKFWEIQQNKPSGQKLTVKQMQQEVQRVSGQNGYRFVTIAQRANQLLSLLGGIYIFQFHYITPHYLFHLSSSNFEYFIRQINENMNRALDNFAGAQS